MALLLATIPPSSIEHTGLPLRRETPRKEYPSPLDARARHSRGRAATCAIEQHYLSAQTGRRSRPLAWPGVSRMRARAARAAALTRSSAATSPSSTAVGSCTSKFATRGSTSCRMRAKLKSNSSRASAAPRSRRRYTSEIALHSDSKFSRMGATRHASACASAVSTHKRQNSARKRSSASGDKV